MGFCPVISNLKSFINTFIQYKIYYTLQLIFHPTGPFVFQKPAPNKILYFNRLAE